MENGKFAGVAEYELPPKEGEEDTQKIRLLVELDLRNKNGVVRNLTNLTGFSKGEFDIGGKFTPNGLYWLVSSDGGKLRSLFFDRNGTVTSQQLSSNYKLYAGASLSADASEPEPKVAATFRTFQNRTAPNRTELLRGVLQGSRFVQIGQRRVNTVEQICMGSESTYLFTEYEMWRHNQRTGEFRKLLGKERQGDSLYGTCMGAGNSARARKSTPRQGNVGGDFGQSGKTVRMDKEDFIIMGKEAIRVGTQGREETDIVEAYIEQEDGRFVEVHNHGAQLLFNSSMIDKKSTPEGNSTLNLDLVVQGPNPTESSANSAKVSIKIELVEKATSKQEEFALGALTFKKTAASQALGTLPEFEARLCSDLKYCRDHFWKFMVPPTTSNTTGYKASITNRFEVKNYSRGQNKSDITVSVVTSLGIDVFFDNNQFVASLSGIYSPIAVKDYTGKPVKKLDSLDCEYFSDRSGSLECTLVFRVIKDQDTDSLRILKLDVSTRPKIFGQFGDVVVHSDLSKGFTKRIESKKGKVAILSYQKTLLIRDVVSKEDIVIKNVGDFQLLTFSSEPDSIFVLVLHNFLKVGSQKLGVRLYTITKQKPSEASDVTESFPALLNLGLVASHSCVAATSKIESWSCVFGSNTKLQQLYLSAPVKSAPNVAWYRLLTMTTQSEQHKPKIPNLKSTQSRVPDGCEILRYIQELSAGQIDRSACWICLPRKERCGLRGRCQSFQPTRGIRLHWIALLLLFFTICCRRNPRT